MTTYLPSRADGRVRAAIGVALVHALLGYALIRGFAVGLPDAVGNPLKLFDLAPAPPPLEQKSIPPRVRSKKPEGAASPPNLTSKATEIVAPPPVIRLLLPLAIVTTEKPGVGGDPSSGASTVRGPGPGTGSGGVGFGTGSGGFGDGDGGGGRDETPPRWRKGRIKNSDYPGGAGDAGIGGTVSVRYVVLTTGRVTACQVTQSSGNTELDATTCRLIEQRFRYEPSRDSYGRPVESAVVESHSWAVEEEPAAAAEAVVDKKRRRALDLFNPLPFLRERRGLPR